MKTIFNLQDVIDYIENHLYRDLDLKSYVEKQGFLYDYISKVFNTVCGISIQEYIRKRTLSVAAIELIKSSKSILDISLKYGYSSQGNFSRAMKEFHGLSLLQIRKTKTFKQFNKMQIELKVNGGNNMEVTTTELKDITISTIKQRFVGNPFKSRNDILEFWQNSLTEQDDLYKNSKQYGKIKKIYGLIKIIDDNTFDYHIGYETINPSKLPYGSVTLNGIFTKLITPKDKYPTKFIKEAYNSPLIDKSDKNDYIVEVYHWYLPESKDRNNRFVEILLPNKID